MQWPRQVHRIKQRAQSAAPDERTQTANRSSRNVGNTKGDENYLHRGCGRRIQPATVAAFLTTRTSKGLDESRPETMPGEMQVCSIQDGTAHTSILALERPRGQKVP